MKIDIDKELAEKIFAELKSSIDDKAYRYADDSWTFRMFTDKEKNLLDSADFLSKKLNCHDEFYRIMNKVRKYFCGNNY